MKIVTIVEYRVAVMVPTGRKGRPRKLYVAWDRDYGEALTIDTDPERAVLFDTFALASGAGERATRQHGRFEVEEVRS